MGQHAREPIGVSFSFLLNCVSINLIDYIDIVTVGLVVVVPTIAVFTLVGRSYAYLVSDCSLAKLQDGFTYNLRPRHVTRAAAAL